MASRNSRMIAALWGFSVHEFLSVQGFFFVLLLFFAFYQFALPLKTNARMLFLLFQQALSSSA
jgi:hypothetical protein